MIYLKFKALLVFLILLFTNSILAQTNNILSASTPSEVGVLAQNQKQSAKDKPLEYGYVAERDILWSKVVWENID